MKIPFNKPLFLGTEKESLFEVLESGHLSANGKFTENCHQILENQIGYRKALLTTSCTSALELAAMLLDVQAGDEIIIPSYAFVTTANAFASRGANVVFADSRKDHPNIDENRIDALISTKTKAIVALHYGGVACNMDAIMSIAQKHNIQVIEDNAQGIGSTFNNKPLGGIGDLGAVSFHETKNVHCGEGGALLVNKAELEQRASVVWDMGTDKEAYKQGKVASYGWVDIGSSFYPSELNAGFLLGQLFRLEEVNAKRMDLWQTYYGGLESLESQGFLTRPKIADYAKHNAHTFYLIVDSKEVRDDLISYLKNKGIFATFHFQSLHTSKYFTTKYSGEELPNADRFSDCLVRLPLYYSLDEKEQEIVISSVQEFYHK